MMNDEKSAQTENVSPDPESPELVVEPVDDEIPGDEAAPLAARPLPADRPVDEPEQFEIEMAGESALTGEGPGEVSDGGAPEVEPAAESAGDLAPGPPLAESAPSSENFDDPDNPPAPPPEESIPEDPAPEEAGPNHAPPEGGSALEEGAEGEPSAGDDLDDVDLNLLAILAHAGNLDGNQAADTADAHEPDVETEEPAAEEPEEIITATREEIKPVIECLLFVAEEPLSLKVICKVLGTVPEEEVRLALETLIDEFAERESGLEIREVAGGWRISTRPQHHDFIRQYLKTRPSARLSLPALETLAVIAYKQPITIPEILEIRGVSSSSAIKTLLEKRLIVTKGRKETVGRPMMYGTSRDFLIQFGLRDLTELPSIEDVEDLAQ